MSSSLQQIDNWSKLGQQSGFSVSRLARLCNVSIRTLERHFLEYFGKSPKSWLAEQRNKQAAGLLHDNTSVKEVASLVGYRHASTFTREFKKYSGQCPIDLAKPPVNSAIADVA
jgi:AraC family transcriptional regulator, exoenzyme S synthesis regulatory protein ExsA